MNSHELKITQELFIPTAIEDVWTFLMNEEKMKDWLNADAFVIDMSDGGKIEIPLSFGDEEVLILGEFSILLFEEKYAFVWRERDIFGDEWFNCTIVNFDLEKKENGTLLKLSHDGFKYLPSHLQKQIHQRYTDFWIKSGVLENLRSAILAEQ